MSKDIPTTAQARRMARMFADNQGIAVGGYSDATNQAIIKRGWVADSGQGGFFPNGEAYTRHALNEEGLDALERYFWDLRLKRSEST